MPNQIFDNRTTPLDTLQIGQSGIIHQFTHDILASKLMSMGILPGKSLTLVRRMPFGGGLFIKVGNQSVALRQEEAHHIVVISV